MDALCQMYDYSRVPVGLNIIGRFIKNTDHILDVGCGTGNYIERICPYVAKMTGIDANEEVLAWAKNKCSGKESGNVEFVQSSLLDKLPFEDATFDVVMVNQVLQYLDTDMENYPNIRTLLIELRRVLKPSGYIFINTCTKLMVDSYWYMALYPPSREEFVNRYIGLDKLAQMMLDVGYDSTIEGYSIVEPLQGVKYFNLMGPIDATWRFGSNLQVKNSEEMEIIRNNLLKELNEGKLGAYFDEHDKFRRENGQSIYVVGKNVEKVTKTTVTEEIVKII